MTKVNIMFYSSPNYSGNAKALYDYIKKNYRDKFNLYWAVDNDEDYALLKRKLKCIKYPSPSFDAVFEKINIIFTTHGQLMDEKTKNQIYVNLWHGISPKKMGYILDEDKLAPQDRDFYFKLRRKTDYIICPSYFWQMVSSEKFKTNACRILPIAYPKLDTIIYSSGEANLKKVLNQDISKYNKLILYTPTFKKGLGRKDVKSNIYNIFDFEKYDEKKLLSYLKNNNYLLIVKYHPSEETKFKKVEHSNVIYLTEEMLRHHNMDVNNILNGTDILITDFSSLGVEYTILDKPVIYLNNNVDEYTKNRGILFDSSDFWMENKASNIGDLIENISNCGDEVVSNNRKLFYGDLKDGGCKNIVEYFFDKDYMLKKNITNYVDDFDEVVEKYKKLKRENNKNELIIEDLKKELRMIYNSKSWKILEKLRKMLRRIK